MTDFARPWWMRICPAKWREAVYYRFLQKRTGDFASLYTRASLLYAHDASMWDLIPGDVISGCVAFGGVYEWHLTQMMVELVKGGAETFIDVGANMGYFSVLWASLSTRARVISFEPVRRNLIRLANNRERNSLGDRIKVIDKAASNYSGEVRFAEGPELQTGWGGMSTEGSLIVPCVRLDEIVEERKIDLLKVDVEGAEAVVLRGCERLLGNRAIRRIVFEYNRERAADYVGEDPCDLLEIYGYRCTHLKDRGGMWLAELPA